jgi:hypothetical protein
MSRKNQRYQKLTPPLHGSNGTTIRIAKAKKMAAYEAEAKRTGKTVTQVIAESIQ